MTKAPVSKSAAATTRTVKTSIAKSDKADPEMHTEIENQAADAANSVAGLFQALTNSGRSALEGVIAVDKALFGYAGNTVKSYSELGRQSVKAKSVSDLFDLHVAHAHNRIEQNAANTREVLQLAQTKAKEAYAPLQDALTRHRAEVAETS